MFSKSSVSKFLESLPKIELKILEIVKNDEEVIFKNINI